MLKKLFTYHFQAILRAIKRPLIALPISVGAMLLILLSGMLVPASSGIAEVVNYGLTAILFLVVALFLVLFTICLVQIPTHCFRSDFGSDAPLLRMIPATKWERLLAAFLSGVLWTFILLAILLLSAVVGLILPAELTMRTDGVSVLSSFSLTLEDYLSPISPISISLWVLCAFLLTYAAMTIGATAFERRRTFGAVFFLAIFFLADFLLRRITGVLISPFTMQGEILSDLFSILLSLFNGAVAFLGICAVYRQE